MKYSMMQLNLLLTKSSTIMIYKKSDIFYGNRKHLRKDIGQGRIHRHFMGGGGQTSYKENSLNTRNIPPPPPF